MPRLLSNATLREKFFSTVEESEALLTKFRFAPHKLKPVERQAVWVLLAEQVSQRANRHYKQSQKYGTWRMNRSRLWYETPNTLESGGVRAQKGFNAHLDRIMMLIEFLKLDSNKGRTAGWCIVAWKRRFALFEAVREMRDCGIRVPLECMRTKEIQAYVDINAMLRRHDKIGMVDFEEGWLLYCQEYAEKHNGDSPTPYLINKFCRDWANFNHVTERTKYAVSYDSYVEVHGEI